MTAPHSVPPAQTAAPARTDWLAVYAALFCGIAVAFNIGKVPIALAALRQEFGLTLVQGGWVASTFNTLAVFTAMLFGLVCDRLGQMRTAALGLALSLVGGCAAVMAHGMPWLFGSRIVEGFGFLSVAVSAPGLISHVAQPADRRFAMGLWATFMPVGVGLAMIAGPLVMPYGGWRAVWFTALAGFALAAVLLYARRRAFPTHFGTVAGDSLAVARDAVMQVAPWLFGVAFCAWAIQYFALVIWLPTFLREQRGLAPLAVGLLTAIIVLINAPGTVLGGMLLSRKVGRGTLIAYASMATGLLSVAIYLDGLPDVARYACCLLLSFIGGLIPTAVLSSPLVLAKSPRQIGTLQGLFMQCTNIAQFIGPPAIAALVTASGHWRDALYVTGSSACVCLLFGLAIRRYERRAASAAPAALNAGAAAGSRSP